MMSTMRSLVRLSWHDCKGLLAAVEIGRVAFVANGLPVVVPVTFAVQDDAVVIRTAAGTRLAAAAARCVLAFETGGIDLLTRTGWSVTCTGRAEPVSDSQQRARIRSVLEPWAPGTHDIFLRLPLTTMTGQRISVE